MPDLFVVFVIGLFGSAHCVGMCGGFVLALSQMHGRSRRLQTHQLLYFSGKTLTYTLMGAVAGGLGAALGAAFAGLQDVLSIALGLVLIVLGLGLVGVLRRFEGWSRWSAVHRLTRTLGGLLRRRSPGATVGLGMVNGLLPCGLVYALMVQAAATGTVLGGALTMAVFGLATVPALYLVALSGFLARPLWRKRLNLAGGVLVIVLGVLTLVRGTPAQQTVMQWLPGAHGHPTVQQVEMPAMRSH